MDTLEIIMILRLQVGCLCFTMAVAIPFFATRRAQNFINTLFSYLIIVQIVSLFFDMITVYTVNHFDSVSPYLNKLFHIMFIFSLCLFTYLTFLYIRQLVTDDHRKKWLFTYSAPLILATFVAAYAPMSYEESNIGNYSTGLGIASLFCIVGVYMVMMFYLILRYWRRIDSDKRRIILIALVTEICISLTQFLIPALLITSLGTTIITLAIYLTIENPDRVLRRLFITEKLRAEAAKKKIEEIAYIDTLTGIMNRRQFMSLAVAQIKMLNANGGSAFLIMFDIDNFKKVNDTHGHLIGDKVLICVTERVQKALRPYDIFGRFGGEEFTILVSNINSGDIKNYADRLRSAIDGDPMSFDGVKLTITASFGVAPISENGIDSIIRVADEALYQAKSDGRNRVVVAL